MRLPFVSRARLDVLQAQLHTTGDTLRGVRIQLTAEIREAERERAESDARIAGMVPRDQLDQALAHLGREAARVDALTKVILRMKSTGAVLLPPESVQATRGPARVQTPIEQAIDSNPRARGNPGLARHLFNYAAQAKQDGMQEEDVLEKLRSWGAPTHDDDTEDDAL